jgi:hypothetical protein
LFDKSSFDNKSQDGGKKLQKKILFLQRYLFDLKLKRKWQEIFWIPAKMGDSSVYLVICYLGIVVP